MQKMLEKITLIQRVCIEKLFSEADIVCALANSLYLLILFCNSFSWELYFFC